MRRVSDVFEIVRPVLPRGGQHDVTTTRVVVHERRHVVDDAIDGEPQVVISVVSTQLRETNLIFRRR